MKVVALKVFTKQKKYLKLATDAGIYPSVSEALRAAGWDLLNAVLKPQEQGLPAEKILVSSEIEKIFESPTKSISGKFPLKMISLIDWIVSQHLYRNRSEFFRVALSGYLASDGELFSHFLSEKKEDNNTEDVYRKISY